MPPFFCFVGALQSLCLLLALDVYNLYGASVSQ